MRGGDAVWWALRSLDVEHVFGIVSIHNLPIVDAIARRGEITFVGMRHEQAAVHAADGYARTTGRLGVALASTGPGTTNAVTGLYEAEFSSSPVLLLTGQVPTTDYGKARGALHEAEAQVPMLRTVTRRVESPREPSEIFDAVVRAGVAALAGRPQPTAVEIPIDVQEGESPVEPPGTRAVPAPAEPRGVDGAVAALAGASRRLIWAGAGVHRAGANEALRALAERLQAPVVTSVDGRGALPDSHPLSLGPIGADRGFADVLGRAEVVLAVGTRFEAGDTGSHNLRLPGTLVHVDADPGVLGRVYRADHPVIGDARLALDAMLGGLDEAAEGDGEFLAAAQAAGDSIRATTRSSLGPDHGAMMDALREVLPDDAPIICDSTVPAYVWANRILPIEGPRTYLRASSGAIGPGLPLGIGAAVGTGRPTVVICGDGGVLLHIGELAAAAQAGAPLIVCIFNDGAYGILRILQQFRMEGRQAGVDLTTPDFVKVAEGLGVRGEKVTSSAGFRSSLEAAVARGGPTVLDIDLYAMEPMMAFGGTPYPQPRPT